MTNSIPEGWHSVTPRLVVHDTARLVEFLKQAFGATGDFRSDIDATYRRALKAGAVSLEEPQDMPYGDRRGMVKDPCGNIWQIATHEQDVSLRELGNRL